MEEEIERKIFYRKDYDGDVKKLADEAEEYAKGLRAKYSDVIVTKEYIHGDDILVRATTIRMRYRNEQIRDRERERIREREHGRSRGGRSRSR